jgi:ribosomal protein S18 acetylase RimI-like enzyme
MIEVRPATEADVPALTQVVSDAVRQKAAHGDFLWGDKAIAEEEIAGDIAKGNMYAVTVDGEIAATLSITEDDERVWEDQGKDGQALYVHGLATSDRFRGQNLGGQILEWVDEEANRQGKTEVRLDCSYTNRDLSNYYEKRGFVEVRRRDIPRKSTARDLRDPIYKVALFRRPVTRD